ncbi:MAG: protein-L-isoaspartate O-methyltransferase, partial [Thermoplasmatota archaeon]
EGMRIMEIGIGSGYHAAVTSRLVGDDGWVYTVERIGKLVMKARRNLSEAGIQNVTVVEGDGSIGIPQEAPYDRIYYTCAAPDVPDIIKNQVKDGGMILAPVGPKQGTQRLMRLTREDDIFEEERLTYCMFVPLVGEKGY